MGLNKNLLMRILNILGNQINHKRGLAHSSLVNDGYGGHDLEGKYRMTSDSSIISRSDDNDFWWHKGQLIMLQNLFKGGNFAV